MDFYAEIIDCFGKFEQIVFADWFRCDMPDTAHLRIIRNDGGNDIGESVRRQTAENAFCSH